MPNNERRKIAIIGAGAVGSTIAYAAMQRGLAQCIILVDLIAAKAEAEAKDLMHGSMFVPPVDVRCGGVAECAGASVVVITAGVKQKPGQTRLDLLRSNALLFENLLPKLMSVAPHAIYLVVSNPVDVLTYIAWKITGLPRESVFGSGTVLDTSRFRALLARRLKVAVGNVHAYIVGEHGDSEVPLWSSAQVGNIPLADFSAATTHPISDSDRQGIFHNVRDAAAQVVAAKGATNWAIGLAVARILEAILRDEDAVLTVSTLIEDYFGIGDVCLSVPCLVDRAGAGMPIPLRYDVQELVGLKRSAEVLRSAGREVGY